MIQPIPISDSGGVWMPPGTPVCFDVALSAGTGVALNDDGVTSDEPILYALKVAMSNGYAYTIVFNEFSINKLYLTLHNVLGDHTK